MALGRGESEVARIVKMMSMVEDWGPVMKTLQAVRSGHAANEPKPSGAAGQAGAA